MIGRTSDNPFTATDAPELPRHRPDGDDRLRRFRSTTKSNVSIRRKFDKFTLDLRREEHVRPVAAVDLVRRRASSRRGGNTPSAVSQYDLIGRSFYIDLDAQVLIKGVVPTRPCAPFSGAAARAIGGPPAQGVALSSRKGALVMAIATSVAAIGAAASHRLPALAAAPSAADLTKAPLIEDVSISPDGKHLVALTSPDGAVRRRRRLAHRRAERAAGAHPRRRTCASSRACS